MKLKPNQDLTQPRIFEGSDYVHPWDAYVAKLNKPNPPSQQSVEQAQFVDKTYHWNQGGSDSVRPRNKRTDQ